MQQYIDEVKQQSAYLANPYLTGLRDGSMSLEDFIETQIQFFFAVVFFSRPIAALASRLPRPELRRSLLENISDEHGGNDAKASHEHTFRTLLSRLGIAADDIERRSLWPEVRAFNTVLAGLGALDDLRTGLAAYGIIELMFADISADIGRSMVARGFLAKDRLIHYPLHQELDCEHAEGFFKNLRSTYDAQPHHRYQVNQGLDLGGYIFMRLYCDLWHNRTRRWQRPVAGTSAPVHDWF